MTLACIWRHGDLAVARRFRAAAASGLNRFGKTDPTGLIGTVDEVGERLRAYAAAGLERVYLRHPTELGLEPIALIGRELVPALA